MTDLEFRATWRFRWRCCLNRSPRVAGGASTLASGSVLVKPRSLGTFRGSPKGKDSAMKTRTLGEIADYVDGQLHGDPQLEIVGADTIREAVAGQITLAHHPKYADAIAQCDAVAVITNTSFRPETHPYIVVANVAEAFAKVVQLFRPQHATRVAGVHPSAVVDPTATIDPTAFVGPRAVVEADTVIEAGVKLHAGVVVGAGSSIGAETVLFPNVVLYQNTVIGKRCIVHGNATIGAYGFGYDSSSGRHVLSQQLGNVVIEDDVEVGANATIDRGTYGSTSIGAGTKIDNLVQIAHNCRIGRHNMLCSQVGIAGSAVTGDYVVMAGQVGVRDHVDIGDRVRLGAKSGVSGDIPEGETFLGVPARPERQQIQQMVSLTKLPDTRKQVRAIQKKLDQLEALLSAAQSDETPDAAAGKEAA